ncbi:MAG: baseplate J/gp47 family protein [Candidatus Sabulitectum sp.]|nr:baseplate J/gp47 family protein [Candidatus Sabulitectum sp.]
MAQITDAGIIPKTLSEYQSTLRVAFLSVFGEDIDVDPKSPQGQWIDNIALGMSQSDDVIVSVAGAANIFRAFKAQLEGLGALLGIPKNKAEATIVTGTIGGTPGATITAGSRARSNAGDLYALKTDALIGVGGTVDATFEATVTGPIQLLAGELTSVVDVVPGWETITNAADGVTGRDIESDVEYRNRYFRELFRNALSVLDSIVAQVSSQDNVTEVIGEENDTGSPLVIQNITVDPHSIAIVVDGGLDIDIKDAIRLKKTGGTATTGTTVVPDPPHSDINFFRVSFVNPEVTVTTTAGVNFPADGVALIKQRTFDYINGGFLGSSGEEFFEIDGMRISEDLQKHRLYTPLNSVPGHVVSGLTLEDKASPGDVAILVADLDEKIKFLSIDDINVVLL